MVYSKSLAARLRQMLSQSRGIVEKKMFGGIAFLLRGNMLVGVWQDSLIVRLGSEQAEQALTQPHVRAFDITGRPMRGWVMVDVEGLDRDRQLADWIEGATAFVATLPAK
jgi:TfoX/Sxy family transcriptional regulator of competence genes